ncbi:MAG: hypothetical protein Q9167_005346 [Letrouitia subvulpina]
MAKPSKSKKLGNDSTPVAPRDINGDISVANELDQNSPRSRRKRAGDFFDFEDDKAVVDHLDKGEATKATKSKKKLKTTSHGQEKAKSKGQDGHPFEAIQAHTSRDVAEVEQKKPSKPKKGKKSKSDDLGDMTAKETEAPDTKAETKRSTKSKGSKDAEVPPSQASAIKSVASPKSTNDIANSTIKPKSEKSKKPGTAPATREKTVDKDDDQMTPVQPKSKAKSKKPITDNPKANTSTNKVGPADEEMDQAPFKALLKKERAKPGAVVASAATSKLKDKPQDKKVKQATDIAHAVKSGVGLTPEKSTQVPAGEEHKSRDSNQPIGAKGEKRKPSTKAEAVSVGTDALDTVADQTSKKKRQKKSRSSVIETASSAVGNLLATGIEAATKGVNAAKELASGTNKAVVDDIAETAEKALDSKSGDGKERRAKSRKKSVEAEADVFEGDSAMKSHGALAAAEAGEADDVSEDDQVAALVQGFDPDEDEAHSGDEGFKEGQKIPKLPQSMGISKKLKAAKESVDGPGVIYVGRIPHGFYEAQMRQYFSQFGTVLRLRLSRNRTTGASKHYAFIEFESTEVAKIAAEAMNNYLMFGHILKCNIVPHEQLHENLWKGANKHFKKVPWSKIEGRKLEAPVGREQWEKRVEAEKERRKSKGEKLKEIGYEFEAKLKEVKDVPIKQVKKLVGSENTEERTIVTGGGGVDPVVVSEEIKTKKTKKERKRKAGEKADDLAGSVAKKVKKSQKAVTE